MTGAAISVYICENDLVFLVVDRAQPYLPSTLWTTAFASSGFDAEAPTAASKTLRPGGAPRSESSARRCWERGPRTVAGWGGCAVFDNAPRCRFLCPPAISCLRQGETGVLCALSA